jgi:hypothetical protein
LSLGSTKLLKTWKSDLLTVRLLKEVFFVRRPFDSDERFSTLNVSHCSFARFRKTIAAGAIAAKVSTNAMNQAQLPAAARVALSPRPNTTLTNDSRPRQVEPKAALGSQFVWNHVCTLLFLRTRPGRTIGGLF